MQRPRLLEVFPWVFLSSETFPAKKSPWWLVSHCEYWGMLGFLEHLQNAKAYSEKHSSTLPLHPNAKNVYQPIIVLTLSSIIHVLFINTVQLVKNVVHYVNHSYNLGRENRHAVITVWIFWMVPCETTNTLNTLGTFTLTVILYAILFIVLIIFLWKFLCK